MPSEYRPPIPAPGVADWHAIPDHPHYEFSVYLDGDTRPVGHVRTWRARNGRGLARVPYVLSPFVDRDGYRRVSLVHASGRKVQTTIHQLALAAYCGPAMPGEVTRHLDGDRQNNLLSNLRRGTPADNSADTARHGSVKGASNSAAVLTEADVLPILQALVRGETQANVARRFGVHVTAVSFIATGRSWRSVTATEPCASLLATYQTRHAANRGGGVRTMTEAAVVECLRRLVNGEARASVARSIDVDPSTLGAVVRGTSWRSVTAREPCASLLAQLRARRESA